MTKRKAQVEPALEATEQPSVQPEVEEATVQEPDKSPVSLELHTSKETSVKEKPSKESIEASIQEKLSKRSDTDVDPFVPAPQLQKEVKDIANTQGFPLNRGTEAGAALMARARRNP